MSVILKGNAITISGEHLNADTAMGWYVGMDTLPAAEIASKFMSGIDPHIAQNVKKGDILVCGRNFGYGKAHDAFFTAMKFLGIECIVAESFSTQLIQSAIGSYGGAGKAPFLVECPNLLKNVAMGDFIEVDCESATVKNETQKNTLHGNPFPEFLVNIMKAGGQLEFVKQKMKAMK
jgi:3-isopropylmalate/(R)-2-methylmalate dehydratase small subunit